MILTLNNKLLLGALLLLAFPGVSLAQSSLALSVTPTLFEISAVPEQVWQSSIKVVNTNPYPLEVYTSVVNFLPEGERGRGKFVPVEAEYADGSSLAEWISLAEEAVTIPAESSRQVRFTVSVPKDAPPGGHFAALLVGTQPPENDGSSTAIRTSQVVTSLFFLRLEGDVVESAQVRSFTTESLFSETPTASFELRLENKGNVHLQPQGTIEIFNMWGAERGSIPINQGTRFGNVLPSSVRSFTFVWEGEPSIVDIGRYKAVASLAYGQDNRQFVTADTHFWVVPIKALIAVTLGLIVVFLIIRWSITAYVRRMLLMAGVPEVAIKQPRAVRSEEYDVNVLAYTTIAAPVKRGWGDFLAALFHTPESTRWESLKHFVAAYWKFIGGVTGIVVSLVLIITFVQGVTKARNYDVTLAPGIDAVSLNAETLRFRELVPNYTSSSTQSYPLTLINTSGTPGTAAVVAAQLASSQYSITDIDYDDKRNDRRTVIVFDLELKAPALRLSEQVGGALLSARTASSSDAAGIVMYVGEDQVVE